MSSDCTFCRIVAGDEPSEIVWRDESLVAFLDERPLFEGHVLLVPAAHIVTFEQLPHELIAPLFEAAQRIAQALRAALGAQGTFVAMNNSVSQSVPHLHVHIVPRRPRDGLKGFFWPRHKYASPERMRQIAADIAKALQ